MATGADRAVNAVSQALNSPLLEVNPEGARGVLLGISGGRDLTMNEINEAAKLVAQTVDPGARIIFGAYYDRRLKPNQIKVTLVATGFNDTTKSTSLFGSFQAEQPTFFTFGQEKKSDEKEKKEDKFFKKEESPTVEKKDKEPQKEAPKEKTDEDIWDIPAFLRRKKH
jgi:cell division protein FtsZ